MKQQTIIVLRHGGAHLIKPLIKTATGRGSAGGKAENSLTMEVQGKLVVFKRDPRNRVVSAYRWKQTNPLKHPGSEHKHHDEMLAQMISRRKKGSGGRTMLEFMHDWADRWMKEPDAFQSSFEQLMDPAGGIIHAFLMARHLGTTDAAMNSAYLQVVGKVTYTGRHSNWREWFGPKTMAAWQRARGDQLLEKMGYE